jgi:asparagine synthase (glutamine-hydrolysing)
MCGIFTILNNTNTFTPGYVEEEFNKIKHRGKKISNLSHVGMKITMGNHSNEEDNIQPIIDGDIILICDGTIFNYAELCRYTNTQPKTNNNNEIIIHLYRRYGIEHTLQLLDGDYCFILLDNSSKGEYFKLYIAKDPFGTRTLYMLSPDNINPNSEKDQIIAFSSELKGLYNFWRKLTVPSDENGKKKPKSKSKASLAAEEKELLERKYSINDIEAGTYTVLQMSSKVFSSWNILTHKCRYYSTGFNSIMYHSSPQYHDKEVVQNIQRFLIRCIEKRCSMSNGKKMACLLSGGIDSSIVAGLVRQYHVSHGLGQLETYSLTIEGGEDSSYAKRVAEYLGTNHTEILIKEKDIYDVIPEVIRIIESYDVATVRGAACNYIIAKYIANYSEATVIFTGDGADELFGGYLYMYLADDSMEFDCEIRRAIKNMAKFDMVRLNKIMSYFGFQLLLPYLDRSLVQYYLSVPPQIRFHTRNAQCEKFLMRLAFIYDYYRNSNDNIILPEDCIWRTKEEFFDGITNPEKPSYIFMQEYTNGLFMREFINIIAKLEERNNIYRECSLLSPITNEMNGHLIPETAEQYIYRKEFEKNYKGCGRSVLDEFWIPKYNDKVYDPSARTLELYNQQEEDLENIENNENIDILRKLGVIVDKNAQEEQQPYEEKNKE